MAYSFYSLSANLADELKTVFVSTVAVQTISNITDIFAHFSDFRNYKSGQKQQRTFEFLEQLLKIVKQICVYDKREFIKSHLLESCGNHLIDLVSKAADGEDFIKNHLAPCIGALCLSLSKQTGLSNVGLENIPMIDSLSGEKQAEFSCKQVHFKILQRTRYQQVNVRKAAIECVGSIVEAVEQDYLTLLPEAVPFFAELLEDDSEEVEILTRDTLKKMEDILGESMQQYF